MTQPATREALLSAVADRSREVGVEATSVADVLAASRSSTGSLYHHFPRGKEQLVAAAVESAGNTGREVLESLLAESSTVADGVEAWFLSIAIDMQRERFRLGCAVGVAAAEAAQRSDAIREAAADVYTSWRVTIADALVNCEAWAPDAAAKAADAAVTLYSGASLMARVMRDVGHARAAGDTARQMLVAQPPLPVER